MILNMPIRVVHGYYDERKDRLFGKYYNWGELYPLYRNSMKILPNLPVKFRQLIKEKWDKFRSDLLKKDKPLEFTFGYDEETEVSAIAIVHPKDYFSRKIGYNIVYGRIKRQNGNIKSRYKYHPLPNYINEVLT